MWLRWVFGSFDHFFGVRNSPVSGVVLVLRVPPHFGWSSWRVTSRSSTEGSNWAKGHAKRRLHWKWMESGPLWMSHFRIPNRWVNSTSLDEFRACHQLICSILFHSIPTNLHPPAHLTSSRICGATQLRHRPPWRHACPGMPRSYIISIP